MTSKSTMKSQVLNALIESIKSIIISNNLSIKFEDLKIRIEYSRDEKFGDYSTPFLLENKLAFPNPTEITEILIPILKKNPLFSKVDFTPPGFINFRIKYEFVIDYIYSHFIKNTFSEIKSSHIDNYDEEISFSIKSENFNNLYPKDENPKKIIFEFVSANPTGPLNIVSARAAATGDVICNLLQKIGHDVHREFYVNDYGNQVTLLGVSCLARLREQLGEKVLFEEENDKFHLSKLLLENFIPFQGYRGEYIKEIATYIYSNPQHRIHIDSMLKQKDYLSLALEFEDWAVEYNLNSQKDDLHYYGVRFNEFYSEKTLHDSDSVLSVLDELHKSFDIIEVDGKKIFTSTKYGDDKDRVVVREDGSPTYLLADIAYHKTKIDRGFNRIINIWGPDHHGYIARLKGAMSSLGFPEKSFQILLAQQVNILSNGEKVKMSKRLGQFQTMTDLLSELGNYSVEVSRYFFVMRSLESPLDFDIDLAKDQSEKNPVFYLQYAHARICSIFRDLGDKYDFELLKTLNRTEERDRLLFWIARYPEEIYDAAISMEPHRLTTYLYNLSKAFTKFYVAKENKLVGAESPVQLALAAFCKATAICLREGLSILGIQALEKM